MFFLAQIKKMDWTLIMASIALSVFGLISIYSTCLRDGDFSNLYKQAIFFVIALACMFAISFVDNRIIRENPSIILTLYFLCILALIGIFFFAPEIRGIKSWYKIGILSFDPIEPTKIVLILILAKYFSKRHVEMYKISHIILSGIYALVPAILVFFRPEFGSVLVIGAIWLGILLVSGIRLKEFTIIMLSFVVIFSVVWMFLFKPYQKERILNFVAPQADTLGAGWNQNQAAISIGDGGLFGKGIGNGSQTQYGFLPEPQTDFIFSVVAEEEGILGVTVLLGLFALVLWRILKIALNARSNFSRLFAIGLAISIFIQMFINIGMNIGILPVIGIPLPMVSYGGGNFIFTFIAFGILQNMKITES
jgi:rod shape determining protein RodA